MTRSLRRLLPSVLTFLFLLFQLSAIAIAQEATEGGASEGPSPFNGYALTLAMMGLILFIMAKSARR